MRARDEPRLSLSAGRTHVTSALHTEGCSNNHANALAVSRTLLAVFAPRVLRVSAAARRGAAAYADGAQRMVRARTHQSGLVRPPQSEIRWAFLNNFLRTCRWHPCPSVPHTSITCDHIPPFSGPLWHYHTRPLHRHVTSPGPQPNSTLQLLHIV